LAPGGHQERPKICSRPPKTPPVRPRTPKCQCGFAFRELLRKNERSFLNSSHFFRFWRLSLFVTSPQSTPRPHLAHPKPQRDPQECPKRPPRRPQEHPGARKEAPRNSRGAPKSSKGAPKEPPEPPRVPKEHQKTFSSQRATQANKLRNA
jgi:hypothetical protein